MNSFLLTAEIRMSHFFYYYLFSMNVLHREMSVKLCLCQLLVLYFFFSMLHSLSYVLLPIPHLPYSNDTFN